MLDNQTRRELLSKARQSGFPGSILDVFTAYEQGKDLIGEFQQQQQQQLIESQKQMLVEEQERQDRRLTAKMQSDREIAEIKAYGYANSTVDEIHDVIQTVKEQENLDKNYDLKLRELLRKEKLDEQKLELQKDSMKQTIYSKESLEAMRLAQRNKEIEAQNERTKAMILASKGKK